METVRIETTVESETLHLPELAEFVGRNVEIVIRDKGRTSKASRARAPKPAPAKAGRTKKRERPKKPPRGLHGWALLAWLARQPGPGWRTDGSERVDEYLREEIRGY